jgi:hypothetical protein
VQNSALFQNIESFDILITKKPRFLSASIAGLILMGKEAVCG